MRKVVVGASGHVGGAIYRLAKNCCDALGTSTLGSRDWAQLRFDALGDFAFGVIRDTDVVFVAAGISSPDSCSRDGARAWAVNVDGLAPMSPEPVPDQDEGGTDLPAQLAQEVDDLGCGAIFVWGRSRKYKWTRSRRGDTHRAAMIESRW
jgi:hypothetical protein